MALVKFVQLLLNLSLLVTWSAAEECGTKFVDPSSSTVLAQIVVQGKVDIMIPLSNDLVTHSANVTIAKVYKGMNSLKEMGIPLEGTVMVEKFGPTPDPHECVADMSVLKVEEDLLFFLRPSTSRGVMRLTALPLPAETAIMATVEETLCDTCVSPPKIDRVMCRHCAHAPVIRKGKGRKVRLGRRARLGCFVRSKPPPKFSWKMSGVPVHSGSEGIVIRSTNTSSVLIIKKVRPAHMGEYICKAKNEIGETEKVLLLEVDKQAPTPKPKYNVRNAPDQRVCDRVVCLNGGTCYYSPSLDLSFCKCTAGFEGVKCENDISVPEMSDATYSSTTSSKNVFGSTEENVIGCADKSFCQNGGSCYYLKSLSREMCLCLDGFTGTKCQFQFKRISLRGGSTAPSNESTEDGVSQSKQLGLNSSLEERSEISANISHAPPSSSPNGINLNETVHDSLQNDTSQRYPGVSTTSLPQVPQTGLYEQEEYATSGTTGYPGATQAQISGPRENPSTHKVYPVSNVDDEALNLIRSRIASNQFKVSQCSSTYNGFCQNGGTCSYVASLDVVVCICPGGFTGNRCETEVQQVNDFDSDSLKGNHTVSNDTGNNTVACATNICLNGGTCRFLEDLDLKVCTCTEGFRGVRCQEYFGDNYSLSNSSEGKLEMDTSVSLQTEGPDEESANVTEYGVTKPPLSKPIKSSQTSNKHQTMNKSHSNSNSNLGTSTCFLKTYCLNGGTCLYVKTLEHYVCKCPSGFIGMRCQIKEEADPLQESTYVTDLQVTKAPTPKPRKGSQTPEKHEAENRSHVTSDNDHRRVRCSVNICFNGGTCYYSVALAQLSCQCPEGYSGSKCEASSQPKQNPNESQNPLDPTSQKIKSSLNEPPLASKSINFFTSLKNRKVKFGRCKTKSYCFNGGKCRYLHKERRNICICRSGYSGPRCELLADPSKELPTSYA